MISKARINANIDRNVYQEFQRILNTKKKTVTEFLEDCITHYIREEMYAKDKEAFDELAKERATKEFFTIEKECINDGL